MASPSGCATQSRRRAVASDCGAPPPRARGQPGHARFRQQAPQEQALRRALGQGGEGGGARGLRGRGLFEACTFRGRLTANAARGRQKRGRARGCAARATPPRRHKGGQRAQAGLQRARRCARQHAAPPVAVTFGGVRQPRIPRGGQQAGHIGAQPPVGGRPVGLGGQRDGAPHVKRASDAVRRLRERGAATTIPTGGRAAPTGAIDTAIQGGRVQQAGRGGQGAAGGERGGRGRARRRGR